ncbi:hypothetical protein JCM25156A_32600 [Komagataeibacter kakiaceti JCM 25156]|uniref:Uncharacterized protein n=1 Tax=Komagataeibacter swingsii TaxID=215220 RepID=A0A850P6V2_9PROT|nr:MULTISPECIES: hypothetical protein [Komagataeibacter]NVN38320.1 hypothetical protein [Komagataeibacter swingsii]
MARKKADEITANLTDGAFLTTDAFRRASESICKKIHEDSLSICLGASSDMPRYLVENLTFSDDELYEDATDVFFEDIRKSASWNAIIALMRVNDQRFIVSADEYEDAIIGIRIHPDFDRSEINRFKSSVSDRDKKIDKILSLVSELASRE